MKLTARAVAGLQLAPDKSERIWFDQRLPGFGYRMRRGTGEPLGRFQLTERGGLSVAATTPRRARSIAASTIRAVGQPTRPAAEEVNEGEWLPIKGRRLHTRI